MKTIIIIILKTIWKVYSYLNSFCVTVLLLGLMYQCVLVFKGGVETRNFVKIHKFRLLSLFKIFHKESQFNE